MENMTLNGPSDDSA